MTSTISVTPLTSSIGARVDGVDLRSDLDPDVCQDIREAFWKHYVLVFRSDRPPSSEQQNRLAAVFGTPQPLQPFQVLGATLVPRSLGTGSGIKQPDRSVSSQTSKAVTRRDLELRTEGDGWHTDASFTSWVPRAAVLRAEVISPVGGDTSFTSQCVAYDGLSPTMQSWLLTLRAFHVVPPYFKDSIDISQYGDDAEERFDAAFPPREHPVVVEHPETGRRALFVNPIYTMQIAGLTRGESDAVLRFLFTHIAATSNVYRHHWSAGDLVVWDELTTLHRAPSDFAPYDRKVVRVTAGQVVPSAPILV